MKITFVIFSLTAGGAERVVASMANYWAGKQWEITILTLDGAAEPFYELDARVKLHPLHLSRKSRSGLDAMLANAHRVRTLRKALRASGPDLVISSMSETNVVTLLASAGLKVPVFVHEQIDPSQHSIGRAWTILRRLTFPFADLIITLNKESRGYFSEAMQSRCRTIPNPVVVPNGAPPTRHSNVNKRLIAVGRLVPQKGFDLLLSAFGEVAEKHPRWSLEVWGEGPMRTELEAERDRLGLRDRVSYPGVTRDIFTKLKAADLFVLSSRYEGCPVALCEAMACGLPVLSYNCPSGPADIIRDGIDGVLVESGNVTLLGRAMDKLMGDEGGRERLAAKAPEVILRFGLNKVMSMWEEAIQEVVFC